MNIEFRPTRVVLFSREAIEAAEKAAATPATAPRFELRGITYEYCEGADRWIMAPGQVLKPGADELRYGYSPTEFEHAIMDELEDGLYGSAQPGTVAAEEDRWSIANDGPFNGIEHASDCATHNEPAMPNGPCDCVGTLNRADFEALRADLMSLDSIGCEFASGDVVTFKSGGAWMTVECVDLHQDGTFTADLIWTDTDGRLYELDGLDTRLITKGVKLSWIP